MKYKQIGWRAKTAKFASYLAAITILLCLLLYLIGFMFTISDENGLSTILNATFFYTLTIGAIAIFVAYNLWQFPDIEVVETGIVLTTIFRTMHIHWKDIKKIRKTRNEILLFLTRKGLLLNRLYGLFHAKVWDQPIIIFISDEDKINDLEKIIQAHITTS